MATSKLERDKQKLIQDKCQQILAEFLRDEDNKYCVDCDAKGPRWASWNLGIFLCIRCAGIHRNLGVHISKVKSVNLDSWTPEQIGSIQNMGNSKARAVYEANLPDNFSRPQSNTALEKFVRAKYELKKYIAKEWVETPVKPAFDIETELKKDKEKKRSKIKPITSIVQTDIQSNPIPRPNASVNGKTEKVAIPQPKVESASVSTDLLGLDIPNSSNDEFGFFASAETSVTSKATESTVTTTAPVQIKGELNLEKEEQDFFNQKIPDKAEEKKLTKESILSLYAQAPASNPMNGFMPAQTGASTNSLNQFNALSGQGFPINTPLQSNVMASTNPFLANNGNAAAAATASSSLFGDLNLQQQSSLVQNISSLQLNPTASNTQSNWFNTSTPFGLSTATGIAPQASNMANPFLDSVGLSANTSANSSSFSGLSFDNFATLAGTQASLLSGTVSSAAVVPKAETANNNLANFW